MTPGCRGCEAANRGINGIHNERCRLRVEKAIEEKEPDRYARVMARLETELRSEDKNEDRKRVSSRDERKEGHEIEEKRRKRFPPLANVARESVIEDEEMRNVQPQQRQSEATSSSSGAQSGEQRQDQWKCPRCNQCNPRDYKYCPWCPNDQGACRNPN